MTSNLLDRLTSLRERLEAMREDACNPGGGVITDDLLNELDAVIQDAEREVMIQKAEATSRSLLLRAAIEGQEQERQRVARQLHDGLCQYLTALMLGLQVAQMARTWEETRTSLDSLRRNGAVALASVRQLQQELWPSILADFGLKPALEQLATCGPFGPGLRVVVDAQDLQGAGLSGEVESGLYWIAYHSLKNVVRHAGARTAFVTVRSRGDQVEMTIRDDGKGLGGPPAARLGLTQMRERAAMLGGTLSLGPCQEGGAVVQVSVPLRRENDGEDPRPDRR